MRALLIAVVAVHALLHAAGVAQAATSGHAFTHLAPISVPLGAIWGLAAVVLAVTAVLLARESRWWWAVGLAGMLASQIVVIASWSDAKFGTLANLILLAGALWGWAALGPRSAEEEYRREAQRRLPHDPRPVQLVTNDDLRRVPAPVQRYLRLAGVVGKPRVRGYRVELRGRIRSSATSRWMPFTAEQTSVVDPPTRLFLMKATMFGVPVEAWHRFTDGTATMQVKLLSWLPLVDLAGPSLTRAETVTLFNDMCLLAPATLLEPSISWRELDAAHAQATWSTSGHTISAVMTFDVTGALIDFVSEDRLRTLDDGSLTPARWSTPVAEFGSFNGGKLVRHASAVWNLPGGDLTYGEFELCGVTTVP